MSIVDVDALENATWIDRYLGIIEFAGIVVWILHQVSTYIIDKYNQTLHISISQIMFIVKNKDGSAHTDFIPESEPAMSLAIARAASGMSSRRYNSEFYKNAKSINSFFTMLLLLSKYRMKSVLVVDLRVGKIENIITQSTVIHMLKECAGLQWFESWGTKKLSELGLPLMKPNRVVKGFPEAS
ncbi:hypothetical protein AgCh_024021 [Apium graveolens]